jgi:penicillin-binding protein 1A
MSEFINNEILWFKKKRAPLNIIFALLLVLITAILITAGIFYYKVSAEFRDKVANARNLVISGEESSEIFDRDGNVIKVLYFSKRRIYVSLDEISPFLRDAVVASEDERFYKHIGFDPEAVIRATIHNIFSKDFAEGGSTITQQLVRNLFLSDEKKISRKLKEIVIAAELEKRYTKSEILELYLNQAYFGEGCYGAETASRSFFGKNAIDLDLAESTLLVSVLPAPSELSLYDNFSLVKERQKLVLDKMVRNKYISEKEADEIFKKEVKISERGVFSTNETILRYGTDYFVDYVKDEVTKILSASELYKGGLKIYTSLNPSVQKICFESFTNVLNEASRDGRLPKDKKDSLGVIQPQGCVVALSVGNGEIMALVGGRDYSNTKFNRVLAERQPGSSFKIFQYTAAIDKGILAPESILVSEPINIDGWRPREWTYGYFGALTVRNAIKISSNIAAVKASQRVGLSTVIEYAKKMGIKSNLLPVPSLALGSNDVRPLDMAVSYATLSNYGKRVNPVAIKRIEKRQTNEIIYEAEKGAEQVISPQAAYIMTDLLKGPLSSGGTAEAVNVQGLNLAGKTGTSDNYRDGWFVGYNPEICLAIYVGSDSKDVDLSAIPNYGSTFSGQIFKRIISSLFSQKIISNVDWKKPEGIIKAKICTLTGKLANSTCPYRIETRITGVGTDLCPINHTPKVAKKNETDKTQEAKKSPIDENSKGISEKPKEETPKDETKKEEAPKTSFDRSPLSDTGNFRITFGSNILRVNSPVDVNFYINDPEGVAVELYIDGNLVAVLTEYPFRFYYLPISSGEVLFQAVLRDKNSNIIGNKIFKIYIFE